MVTLSAHHTLFMQETDEKLTRGKRPSPSSLSLSLSTEAKTVPLESLQGAKMMVSGWESLALLSLLFNYLDSYSVRS